MASAAPYRTMKQETAHEHGTLGDSELTLFRTRVCERHRQGNCYVADKCPNSHCQTWQRRNPQEYTYSPKLCPEIEFVKRGSKMTLVRRCGRGRACMFAHSKEEELYHPSMYKTKMCNSHPWCKRYFCPFAHSPEELRKGGTVAGIAETSRSTADHQLSGVDSDGRPVRSNTFSGPSRRRETTESTDLQETRIGQQSAELAYCSHAPKPLTCPGSPTSSSTCASNGSASPVLTPVLRPCGTTSLPNGASGAGCLEAAPAGNDATNFRWNNDYRMGSENNSFRWIEGQRYRDEALTYHEQQSGQGCMLNRGFSQSALDSRSFTTALPQETAKERYTDNLTALADSLGLNLHATEGDRLHPYLSESQTQSLISALIASLPNDFKESEATSVAAAPLSVSLDNSVGAVDSKCRPEKLQTYYINPLPRQTPEGSSHYATPGPTEECLALASSPHATIASHQKTQFWLNDAILGAAEHPRSSDIFRQSVGPPAMEQLSFEVFSENVSMPQSEEDDGSHEIALAAQERCVSSRMSPNFGHSSIISRPAANVQEDIDIKSLDSRERSQTTRSFAPVVGNRFCNDDEPSPGPLLPLQRQAHLGPQHPNSSGLAAKYRSSGNDCEGGNPPSLVTQYTTHLNLFSDEEFLTHFTNANHNASGAVPPTAAQEEECNLFKPFCGQQLLQNRCAQDVRGAATPQGAVIRAVDSNSESSQLFDVAANRTVIISSPHTGSRDDSLFNHTLSFFESADRRPIQQNESSVSLVPFASDGRENIRHIPPPPQQQLGRSAGRQTMKIAPYRSGNQDNATGVLTQPPPHHDNFLRSMHEEQLQQQAATTNSRCVCSTSFPPAAPSSFAQCSTAAGKYRSQNSFGLGGNRYEEEEPPHPMYPWSADRGATAVQPEDAMMLLKSYCLL